MRQDRYELLKHLLDTGVFTVDTWKGGVYNREGYRIGSKVATGYEMVSAFGTAFCVHQVIAVAAGYEVIGKAIQHKDGNKRNNRIENLQVATQKDVVVKARNNGLMGRNKLTLSQVREIKNLLFYGVSMSEVALHFPEVSYQAIQLIKRGKSYKEVRI